jgi:hypothetical protein
VQLAVFPWGKPSVSADDMARRRGGQRAGRTGIVDREQRGDDAVRQAPERTGRVLKSRRVRCRDALALQLIQVNERWVAPQ